MGRHLAAVEEHPIVVPEGSVRELRIGGSSVFPPALER